MSYGSQVCGFLAGNRNDQLWDFLELGNGGLFIYNVISQSTLEVDSPLEVETASLVYVFGRNFINSFVK